MENALRYWCYGCSRVVNPIREIEPLKCPVCEGGFVEEMESAAAAAPDVSSENPFDSDRALSLWAPILLGMMSSNPRRRRRFRRMELEEEDDDDDDDVEAEENNERQTELDRELESIIRRRRRSSATILQLLQGIRAGMLSETETSEGDYGRERERVILINPFSQSIVIHGNNSGNRHIGSLGDYFIGPGLDILLQQLADNDPNRYGTPPAQKEAIEAMPVVKVDDSLQCSVCLDDFEIGSGATEMPCKHKFHSGCILPWLELHSSCPVCRYQLPSGDDSKLDSNEIDGSSGDAINGRQFSVPIPWPFSGLFSPSTSGSQSSAAHSSSNSMNTTPGAHTHED